MKKALTLIAASALFATPAIAGDYKMKSQSTSASMSSDFTSYDADGNGEVTFAEFSKHAKKMNMSTTKAAQLFTKMSGGSPTLTQSTFQSAALSNPDSYLVSTPNTAVLSSTSSSYGTMSGDTSYQKTEKTMYEDGMTTTTTSTTVTLSDSDMDEMEDAYDMSDTTMDPLGN